MRLSINKSELLLVLSFITILSLSIRDGSYAPHLATLMVFFCYYIVLKTNKPLISIYTIFISTYFIYMIPYFYFSIPFATRETYQTEEISLITLQFISYFVFVFLLLIYKNGSQTINCANRIYKVNNPFAYWLSTIGIFIFSLLMFNSQGTLLSGGSYRELTEDRYAFIGYSLVFMVVAFISHKTQSQRMILFLVIAIYCSVCLLYGYRLRFLNAGLLTYILFFEHKIKKKTVTALAFSLFFFFSFIGQFRTGNGNLDLMSLLGVHDNQMISNQGGVFLTSNIYLGAVMDGFIGFNQRLGSFCQYLFSSVIPASLYPPSYNLKNFAVLTFNIPGGGFITAYLYVFGGYIAVGVGPFLLAWIFRTLFSREHIPGHLFAYYITAAAMFINWFAYTPTSLFKMAVYSLIGYALAINYGVVKLKSTPDLKHNS